MPNLNRVQIIGRLGKDPDARTTKNGSTVVSFSVAVDRMWKSRDGESRKETDWFNVEAWGKLGQICQKFLGKGRLVFIEGFKIGVRGSLKPIHHFWQEMSELGLRLGTCGVCFTHEVSPITLLCWNRR